MSRTLIDHWRYHGNCRLIIDVPNRLSWREGVLDTCFLIFLQSVALERPNALCEFLDKRGSLVR